MKPSPILQALDAESYNWLSVQAPELLTAIEAEVANGNYDDLPGHNWAFYLIAKLGQIWPCDRTLTVEFAEPTHAVWQIYGDSSEAACNIQDDKITLYFRPGMAECEESISVICHEYAHAVLAPLTAQIVPPDNIDAYRNDPTVQAVENAAKRLGGLLEFAAQYGVLRTVEEEQT